MIQVAILGATGTVGQKFITLLHNHPQFQICELVASERSAGKTYENACNWKQNIDIPQNIKGMNIKSLDDVLQSRVLFSGLDSSVAFEAEKTYAQKGHMVISNAKNHRMGEYVPLVIPEVNYKHLNAVTKQPYYKDSGGGIITNPNCATISFVMALAPLHRAFGVRKLLVQSMQAISGAGYPGVASLDILGNVVPYIGDEEEKMETEAQKILGNYESSQGFINADICISAHANRVPVVDGHTVCVSLSFDKKPKNVADIVNVLEKFSSYPQENKLHSAPVQPIIVRIENNRPQPMLDAWAGKAMSCSIGRIRECKVLDYKFVSLTHNTVRGAAGCAVLNAETALSMGLLEK